jgi:hypothetical protein
MAPSWRTSLILAYAFSSKLISQYIFSDCPLFASFRKLNFGSLADLSCFLGFSAGKGLPVFEPFYVSLLAEFFLLGCYWFLHIADSEITAIIIHGNVV